jgi:hypothetical protein
MAGNFGVGIGSFMSGLEQGKANARAAAAADAAVAQQQFQNNLATNSDARAGAASDLALAQGNNNLAQNKTLFGQQQQDYAAGANLRDLQREDKESDITDQNETSAINTAAAADSDAAYNAAKAKSIFVGKDAVGNPTYSVDGQAVPSQDAASQLYDQTHANRMQTYYNVGGPKIVSDLLASGDAAGAQAFIDAHKNADFQKGVDSLGRLEGAAQVGNWDGVNTHLNAILSNAGYINPANHEASAEPIIDPATGKAAGLTIHYKNKQTGEEITKNFNTMSDLHSGIHHIINPQATVAYNQSIADATNAAKFDAAKGQNKLANDIALANVNSDNTIKENAAKAAAESPEKRATGIRALYENMNDQPGAFPSTKGPDGKDIEMTAAEKMAKAAELYDANIAAARGPAATAFPQQIAPQSTPYAPPASAPILYSRQGAATPAPTPTSPDDVISQRAREWWRGKGVIAPWASVQKAPAPVARGVLETQAPPAHPAQATSGRRSFLGSVGAALSGKPVVSENIDDLPFADRLPGRGANNGGSLLDSIGAATSGKPVVSENIEDLPFSNLIPGRAYVSEDISRLPHGGKRPVRKPD